MWPCFIWSAATCKRGKIKFPQVSFTKQVWSNTWFRNLFFLRLAVIYWPMSLWWNLFKRIITQVCVCVQEVDSCLFHLAECVTAERLTLDTPASGYCTEPLSLRPARFYQHNDITLRGWGCHWVWQTGKRDTTCTCRGTFCRTNDGRGFRDATRKQ